MRSTDFGGAVRYDWCSVGRPSSCSTSQLPTSCSTSQLPSSAVLRNCHQVAVPRSCHLVSSEVSVEFIVSSSVYCTGVPAFLTVVFHTLKAVELYEELLPLLADQVIHILRYLCVALYTLKAVEL